MIYKCWSFSINVAFPKPAYAPVQPPDPVNIEAIRTKQLQVVQMHSIVREIIMYIVFLMVLMTICYATQDKANFMMKDHHTNLLVTGNRNHTFAKVGLEDLSWNFQRCRVAKLDRLKISLDIRDYYSQKFGKWGLIHMKIIESVSVPFRPQQISSLLFALKIMGQPHKTACMLNFHLKICNDFFFKAFPLTRAKILRDPFYISPPDKCLWTVPNLQMPPSLLIYGSIREFVNNV